MDRNRRAGRGPAGWVVRRARHDLVLKNGAVSLDILEQIVNGYIESAKAGGSQA